MSERSWINAVAAWLYAESYKRQPADFARAKEEIRKGFIDQAEGLWSYLQGVFSDET